MHEAKPNTCCTADGRIVGDMGTKFCEVRDGVVHEVKSNTEPEPPNEQRLPPSRVLWEDTFTQVGEEWPERVVLTWRWLPSGESHCFPVYERGASRDAMGNWNFAVKLLGDIPASFFEHMLKLADGLAASAVRDALRGVGSLVEVEIDDGNHRHDNRAVLAGGSNG